LRDWAKGMLIEILIVIAVLSALAFLAVLFVGLIMYQAAVKLWGSIREHIED
jgi:hypothetical protein